jgi:Kdo2-lipid IVA lauroyltransferase/acyltransferase
MARDHLEVRHHLLFHLFRAALAGGSWLPLPALRPFGRAAGMLALSLAARERRVAEEHLALAFPAMSRAQRRELVRAMARHLGLMLAEVVWLWRARPAQVDAVCAMLGQEHLDRALQTGRGAVLVTAHCGNWEMLNARLGTGGIPMTIAVREVYDMRLHDLATALRSRFDTEVVMRGRDAGLRLLDALGRNRVVGLLIDQDIRSIPAAFVPFFGRPAWTPTGAASLALRAGCPAVPAFVHRTAEGLHQVEIFPPLPAPSAGSDEERVRELTATATRAIERQIRTHPAQWVWFHKRWKRQP